jgi:hypothetical protein
MQIDMALSTPWQAFLPLFKTGAISIHVVFSLIVWAFQAPASQSGISYLVPHCSMPH